MVSHSLCGCCNANRKWSDLDYILDNTDDNLSDKAP